MVPPARLLEEYAALKLNIPVDQEELLTDDMEWSLENDAEGMHLVCLHALL